MKALLLVLCLGITTIAIAEEVETECPMMREQNERNNPKANTNVVVEQPTSSVQAVAQ